MAVIPPGYIQLAEVALNGFLSTALDLGLDGDEVAVVSGGEGGVLPLVTHTFFNLLRL